MNQSIPFVLIMVSAVLCQQARAADTPKAKALGSTGDWRVVQRIDPFATPQKTCTIQSTGLNAAGARRERARIRISLNRKLFVMDPSFKQTNAIRLLRKILEYRDDTEYSQFVPHNMMLQRLRVDDGEVINETDIQPKYASWPVHDYLPDFGRFIEQMVNGKTLYYEWKIDRASEHLQYDLKGFKEMVYLAREACPLTPAPAPRKTEVP